MKIKILLFAHMELSHIGYEMIRSHIVPTEEYGVVLKLERFSHLSSQSFEFGSSIGLETLSHHLQCGTI